MAVLVALMAVAGAFASALLGIGGAIVMLPLLLYVPPLLGLPAVSVATASGLATVQVLSASLLGAWLHGRHGSVSRALILWIGPAMTTTSLLAALASSRLAGQTLLAIFAAVATAAGVLTFLPSRGATAESAWGGAFSRPRAALVGAAAGTLVGLVGSGTFVLSPLLLHVLGVPVRVTIGSSLGVAMFAAMAATLGKAAAGDVPRELALAVVMGTAPGVLLGTRVSHRLPPRVLRALLAVLICAIAARAWWDVLR